MNGIALLQPTTSPNLGVFAQDPLFDEAVDVSIGKALIYLEPLNYLMDIEERTSIYDFKGKSMGDLLVEVSCFNSTIVDDAMVSMVSRH